MQATFNHTKIVQLPRLPDKINKQTKTDQGNKKIRLALIFSNHMLECNDTTFFRGMKRNSC